MLMLACWKLDAIKRVTPQLILSTIRDVSDPETYGSLEWPNPVYISSYLSISS